jgi:amino acid adenylation domain-containing protein
MPDENPEPCVRAENLAYVMYTSGSTGKPKGVCVPHRAVVRLVSNTNYLKVTSEDVFLHFAPLAFDASTFEIWAALVNGARMIVFPPYVPSLEEIGRAVQEGVTVLWLTSALFHKMVDHQLDRLSGLRHLLAGGDVLSAAHVRKVLAGLPECTLTNGYGPTENTTFTCTYSMKGPGNFGSSFPIGRPISNTRVYVLDQHGNPVPVGVPGELYAGGDGVARGYLKSPELTALRFIPDPFTMESGARLYRTGDVVRFRRDGTLEFLGRVDHQLKIRGFRVDPEEIEAALREHPEVADAACMPWEDTNGDKRLVAYVTGHTQAFVNDLRRFLQERLPDYMVPSSIMQLSALPMTENGKVDRKALPTPDQNRPELESVFVPPRTETERTITKLWEEVLGIDKVGVNDNFFDLGGHSLFVVLLHNRMKDIFQKELSIVDLFRYPTVSSLAKLLSHDEAQLAQSVRRKGVT